MKNLKKQFLLLLLPMICLTGCELFGLQLQQPAEFDPTKGTYDNQLNMSAWKFIQSRQDLFSDLREAVIYSEVDSNLFNAPNHTFLLLTNQSLTSTTSSNQSYWYMSKVFDPLFPGDSTKMVRPTSWEQFPKEQVKQFILYHMVVGTLSYGELADQTKGDLTFYPTESSLPNGYVAFQEKKEGAMSIYLNNFPTHYVLNAKPRTSNLQTNNGCYIHVMDKWLNYPSDQDLIDYPIHN